MKKGRSYQRHRDTGRDTMNNSSADTILNIVNSPAFYLDLFDRFEADSQGYRSALEWLSCPLNKEDPQEYADIFKHVTGFYPIKL